MTRYLLRARFFLLYGIIIIYSGSIEEAVFAAPVAKAAMPKSPAYQAVRLALFAHLEKQAGEKMKLPKFPSQRLLVWVDGRHAKVEKKSKAYYSLLFEHLLIAQKLLSNDDLAIQKQGFWIASESANFATALLKSDTWLLARIYEAFLLPKVSLANVELWQDPSRGRILEAGVSAFGNAGERDKQIGVLEWLLSIGVKNRIDESTTTKKDSFVLETNTLDWARGTLASLLFQMPNPTRPDLVRALALFESIESPHMKGFKHLQEQVQIRLDQLKEQPIL